MIHHSHTSGTGLLMETSPNVSPMRLPVLRRKGAVGGLHLVREDSMVVRMGKNSGSWTQKLAS